MPFLLPWKFNTAFAKQKKTELFVIITNGPRVAERKKTDPFFSLSFIYALLSSWSVKRILYRVLFDGLFVVFDLHSQSELRIGKCDWRSDKKGGEIDTRTDMTAAETVAKNFY